MEYLSDLLLTAAALGAAAYCVILSRRLKALTSLEGGLGGAIAVLSGQVDDLSRSLKAAQEAAGRTGGRLDGQTARAEAVARKLELLMASMHDLPDDPALPEPAPAARPVPATAPLSRAPLSRAPVSPAPVAPVVWPPSSRDGRGSRDADVPDSLEDPAPRARILRRRHAAGA